MQPDGSVLIADSNNHRIRRVSPTGTITTVAGDWTEGFSGDGGAATAARLDLPVAVAATCGSVAELGAFLEPRSFSADQPGRRSHRCAGAQARLSRRRRLHRLPSTRPDRCMRRPKLIKLIGPP